MSYSYILAKIKQEAGIILGILSMENLLQEIGYTGHGRTHNSSKS